MTRTQSILFGVPLALALALPLAPRIAFADDNKADKADIKKDKADVKKDEKDLKKDKADLKADGKEADGLLSSSGTSRVSP